jgi:CDP-diglyceride synthetase
MDSDFKSRWIGYSLGVLQAFIGVTAAAGGFGLVSDPSGAKMNISLEWLNNTPFVNYFIPGLVLLAVNGVGNVVASITTFVRNKYAPNLAAALGIFLVLYITIEVLTIGLRTPLQPLYFILGLIQFALGLKLLKQTKTPDQIGIEPAIKKLPT